MAFFRTSIVLVLIMLTMALTIACGEGVEINVIPDDPDSGQSLDASIDARDLDAGPDASSGLDARFPDLGLSADAGCDPATHVPEACASGECFGALLCYQGSVRCVVPDCHVEPDECQTVDYVFLIDRTSSSGPFVAGFQRVLTALTASPNRNYFFIDVPGFSAAYESPAANAECYPAGQGWPYPRCGDPKLVIDGLAARSWGGSEYFNDALADLPRSIAWTPGSSRHAFVLTDDEPLQGYRFSRDAAIARLIGTGIRVHVYAGEFAEDFFPFVSATQGSFGDFEGVITDPCE